MHPVYPSAYCTAKYCTANGRTSQTPGANGKISRSLLVGLSGTLPWLMDSPAIAHEVQTSGDVGVTQHIEPNDTPRAGEPNLVWFALTRQGGQPIALQDCQCRLAVYAVPHAAGDRPLQEPLLKPAAAEGYAGVPAAEITFPQVGAYELVLSGKPNLPDAFQPFTVKFAVTVAAGKPVMPSPAAASPAASASASPSPAATAPAPAASPFWVIIPVVLVLLGIGWAIVQKRGNKQ